MSQRKSCSVIIVTYNSSSCIGDCLAPLTDMPDVEIVVVDNDSRDGTAALVRERFPSVAVIALQENIGFGRACNIGVSAVGGSVLFFLNPDAVASAQSIRALVEFCEKHPRAGIVGGRLIDPSGHPLQSMGDHPTVIRLVLEKPMEWVAKCFNSRAALRRVIGRYSAKFRLPNEAQPVDWVSGAAFCCRRQVWIDTGGFDEHFFLYYEDVDLCFRTMQIGWEVWHVPSVAISHQSGASFAGNVTYQKHLYYAGQRYFFQKYYGSLVASFLSMGQKLYRWRRSWEIPRL